MSPTLVPAGRILVVDDDPDVAQALACLLRQANHTVTIARDGAEGLALFAATGPDLVLLDLDMPRMTGFEVCRALKSDPATQLIPVVIVTGQASLEAKVRCWEAGADDFLTKPVDAIEVLTRCRTLLRVRFLLAELDSAEQVVFAFARAVEAKCPYTLGHSERVTDYALRLAARVGVSADDCEILRGACVLHDIGKIGIPDKILNKPGRLTEEEYALVRLHPVEGARILEPLKSVRKLIPLIRGHHERLDGSGYPDGLFGGAIPLLVQILSVVDVYDALTSDRPYRGSMPHERCVELLRSEAAAGRLDAELVNCFLAVVASPMRLDAGAPRPGGSHSRTAKGGVGSAADDAGRVRFDE